MYLLQYLAMLLGATARLMLVKCAMFSVQSEAGLHMWAPTIGRQH